MGPQLAENALSQLHLGAAVPLDVVRDEVTKWVAETDRAAFAASCQAAHAGITKLRQAELLSDIFCRGHVAPQATTMLDERLPTVDEIMRRGATSPMHVNFRGVLAWADKHFPPTPAAAGGPLRRFYQEAAALFWPEVPWTALHPSTPANDDVQYLQHKRYARRYPIDPLPQLLALQHQDPTAAWGWAWMETPHLPQGAQKHDLVAGLYAVAEDWHGIPLGLPGFGRISALEKIILPSGVALSTKLLRQSMTTHMFLGASPLKTCFSYRETASSLKLGLYDGYAFCINTLGVMHKTANPVVIFSSGIHHRVYINLVFGVETTIENGVMKVKIIKNWLCTQAYPPIYANSAGVYCLFAADLPPTEKQQAQKLIDSGHCARIASWRSWVQRKTSRHCL